MGTSRSRHSSKDRSSHDRRSSPSREQRKQRTHRSLLDGALGLLEQQGFSSLSLREVAKQAGIVPTAFYRHFRGLDELGLELVDESIGSLHELLRAVRSGVPNPTHVVQPSLEILAIHVADHRTHFRFLTRERSGGSPALRQAIHREIRLFATELAVDLARDQRRSSWPTVDIQMLADLLVTIIVATIEALIDVEPGSDEEAAALQVAADQMIMVLLGANEWKPR